MEDANSAHRRSEDTISKLREELAQAAPTTDSPACDIKVTIAARDGDTVGADDDIAVVATRDLFPGEVIATDTQRIAIVDTVSERDAPRCGNCFVLLPDGGEPATSACCAERYCSPTCRSGALQTYHSPGGPLCRGALPATTAPHPALGVMCAPIQLLGRLASAFLNSPESRRGVHPLAHPLLSRWKPDFRPVRPIRTPFAFDAHVRAPVRVLRGLGVDVFRDQRWDTWVVLHLVNRISVNFLAHLLAAGARAEEEGDPAGGPRSGGGEEAPGTVYSLGFLLPLFNHACDPNLATEDGIGGRTIKARRVIKKGEELTVNYVDLGLSKDERDSKLKCWFDSCRCDGCNEGD